MEKKLSLAQNATYNTIGTLVYCFCQWATTMVVVRLFDNYDTAGVFQLAISITNIFYAVSCYNIRTFQISDYKDEFLTSDYIGLRFITAGIALILCTLYAIILQYPFKTVLCIVAYMVFKFNETFSDVLHGVDQKHFRMDYVGISYIIRGVLLIVSFTAVIYLTHDVLIAITATAVSTLAVVVFYDCRKTRKLETIKPSFSIKKIFTMLIKCLPIVLSSVCFTAVVTIPRQYLEYSYGESALGYYATVATPIVIIQVLATSIFNPLLSEITEDYKNGNSKKMVITLLKTVGVLTGFTAAAYIGAYILGEFALTLLYGNGIKEYVYLMYAIIACTVLYAVCWLFNGVLTLMRKLYSLVIISVISLLISVFTGKLFIKWFYLNGVSFCIIFCYIIFCLLCIFVIAFSGKNKSVGENCK